MKRTSKLSKRQQSLVTEWMHVVQVAARHFVQCRPSWQKSVFVEDLEGEDELVEDEREELAALLALREEVKSVVSEWVDGVTLVNDAYFEEYARYFAEETGAINRKVSWPYTYIDWSAAAEELRHYYVSVEFCGVEYWVRSC